MNTQRFKIGDRVIVNTADPEYLEANGKLGTIMHNCFEDNLPELWRVEFDTPLPRTAKNYPEAEGLYLREDQVTPV